MLDIIPRRHRARTLKVTEKIESGVIVTVFPDAGDKYLSERFWDHHG